MNTRIKALDCTLRDGGYVNNWMFGFKGIKNILNKLTQANIDIVECGFLSQKTPYSEDSSVFDKPSSIAKVLPLNKGKVKYVAMINYGEYDTEDLEEYDGNSIDGIRVVFHKEERHNAIEYARAIKEKGYEVYIQPMVTVNYEDEELLDLIKAVNNIMPYAMYIVDSFGVMSNNDLIRLFYIMDKNLDKNINMGFHAHNNIQLAYANAQILSDISTLRPLIIDCSVFGMGRGAGNLNSELFLGYLNLKFKRNYKIYPLLEIIDEELNRIYAAQYWGYSLPHFLSSMHNCHPNYASYYSSKNTLTIRSIEAILHKIDKDRRGNYSRPYAEQLYKDYQSNDMDDGSFIKEFKKLIKGKSLLILAPGNSLSNHKELIKKHIDMCEPFIISVNFSYEDKSDMVFFSNEKRLTKWLEQKNQEKFIITSNLARTTEDYSFCFNYNQLIEQDRPCIYDNAAVMLLNLLLRADVNEVFIAGFDGYNVNEVNYYSQYMGYGESDEVFKDRNKAITKKLQEIKDNINIRFLTPSVYKE